MGQVAFVGGRHAQTSNGLFRAIDAAARRRGCTAREAVGLLFATQTGNTEEAADDIAGYDGLIVGCPTWNTGADEYRSGTTWDDVIDSVKELDLAGKPVAVFGCGDSAG